MIDYTSFLATKRRAAGSLGVTVGPENVHPTLFGFQRHIVRWSVHKGPISEPDQVKVICPCCGTRGCKPADDLDLDPMLCPHCDVEAVVV